MNSHPTELTFGVFITPLHSRIVAANAAGLPIGEAIQISTLWLADPARQLAQITLGVETLRYKINRFAKIIGVGVAISGKVNSERTMITQATRLYRWVGFEITATLSGMLDGVPVALGNDAEARSLWLLGDNPALAESPLVTLFLGEGIGGAFVGYGRVIDLAPGHFRVPNVSEADLLPCLCGDTGCLDAYSGGSRIGDFIAAHGLPRLNHPQWEKFATPVAEVVAQLLEQYAVDTLVVGGKRYNSHPSLRENLNRRLAQLTEATGGVDIIHTPLEYAPAHTALTLLNRVPAIA